VTYCLPAKPVARPDIGVIGEGVIDLCMRHVNQVQQTLKRGSAVKRALASFFLAVSGMYVRARRVVQVRQIPVKHWESAEVQTQEAVGHSESLMLINAVCRASPCSMRSGPGRCWHLYGQLWWRRCWRRCIGEMTELFSGKNLSDFASCQLL
jgi:hypothetical protein